MDLLGRPLHAIAKPRRIVILVLAVVLVACSSSSGATNKSGSSVSYDPQPAAPKLSQTPKGDDAAVYSAALTRSESAHHGSWNMTITGADGKALNAASIKFRELRPDFLLGTDVPYHAGAYQLLKDAHFNLMDYPETFTWTKSEPGPGQFHWLSATDDAQLNSYVGDGMTIMAHNLIWFPPPGYDYEPAVFRNLPFDQFVQAYHDHVARLVQAAKGRVKVWDIGNEPMTNWSNAMDLNETQWQQLISAGTKAVKENQPDGIAVVNSYGVKFDGIIHHPTQYMDPLTFYQDMASRNIPYDVSGLELYYNSYWGQGDAAAFYNNPEMTLAEMNGWMDKYGSLKKPLLVTEFSANAEPYPGQSVQDGYWGQRWSPTLQADYVQAGFTIFFSRSDTMGALYFGHYDGPPGYKAGLIDANGKGRESLSRLKALFSHWTTSGSGSTASDGGFNFAGFAGTYQIDAVDSSGKTIGSAQVDLNEGDHSGIQVKLSR